MKALFLSLFMASMLFMAMLAMACDPTPSPTTADGGAAAPDAATAAPDGGAAPPCPGHRQPCSRELPGLNCSPTVCEQIATGALCCLE